MKHWHILTKGCYFVTFIFLSRFYPFYLGRIKRLLAIFADKSRVRAVAARHFDLVKTAGSSPAPATQFVKCPADSVSKQIV